MRMFPSGLWWFCASVLTFPFLVFTDLLWMLFVSIFDEDIVEEEVFLQWKCSKAPANQTGKDAALKSVGTFFAQLQDKKLENTGL